MTQALSKLEALKAEFSQVANSSGQPAANLPQPAQDDARKLKRSLDRLVLSGAAVMIGFFGFIVGWAALSPIDSAAISYGTIGAEGSRKGVQHIDGGVISAILVKEGEAVEAGQELIRLDEVQPRAAVEINASAVRTQSAVIARLEAEANGSDSIVFPVALMTQEKDPAVAELIASQEELFLARRKSKAAQISTLVEQIKQARAQAEIYRSQIKTSEEQQRMVAEELAPKEMLMEKGYETNSRLMPLKRTAMALLGQQEEAKGHIARLDYSITQLQSQINQINSDFRVKVAQELEDARGKLADARERERVARDVLARTVIRSPATGRVLGLAVNTVGGVVGKGEKLLEVVPEGSIVIKARFSPGDGIEINPNMKAELRLLSAKGRKLPLIHGVVRSRSVDARADAQTNALYFDVDIIVPEAELALMKDAKPELGTPVEVIIPTGSRTVLEYMLQPVSESLRHGMREM